MVREDLTNDQLNETNKSIDSVMVWNSHVNILTKFNEDVEIIIKHISIR